MARRSKKESPAVKSLDGIRKLYGISPLPSHDRIANPPFFIGAFSRRGAMSCYHIAGSPKEQRTFDVMRSYIPSTCTKEVADLYFEVASLVSVYFDALSELTMQSPQ